MQARRSPGVALGVVALAFVVAPASAQEPEQTPPATEEQVEVCTVVIEPSPLAVQADAFDVRALVDQELGTELTVTVDEASGLQVAVIPMEVMEVEVEAAAEQAPEAAEAAEKAAEKAAEEGEKAEEKAEEKAAEYTAEAGTAPHAGAPEGFAARQVINLKLDTSAATAGEYQISLQSATGECRGTVIVASTEPGIQQ